MINNGINKLALIYLGENEQIDLFSMDNKVEMSAYTYVGYSPRVNVKFECPDSLMLKFIYDESKFKLIVGQNDAIDGSDLILTDSEFNGNNLTLQLAPSRDYLFESLFMQNECTACKFVESLYKRYYENVDNQVKDQASTKMKWTLLGASAGSAILDASVHNTEPILSGINFDNSVRMRDINYFKSNDESYMMSETGDCAIRMKSPLVGTRREVVLNSYNQDFLQVDSNGGVKMTSQGLYGRNLIGSRFESKNVYKGYYENNQKCLNLLGKLASECYACNVWDFIGLKLLDQITPVANQSNSPDDYLASKVKRCIVTGMKYYYNSESKKQDGDLIKTIYINPIQEVIDELQ